MHMYPAQEGRIKKLQAGELAVLNDTYTHACIYAYAHTYIYSYIMYILIGRPHQETAAARTSSAQRHI